MSETQGIVVIFYLVFIFFQNIKIISLLKDIKEELKEKER